jgi:hypothetical protein
VNDRYTDEEWAEAVNGRPMEALSDERFMTLHRHWIWANSAFRWFERELGSPAPANEDIDLASDRSFSMYLWYSLLWSVVEGIQKHPVVIKGAFRDDLRTVREPLREARNAVMHVSDDAYFDDRLFLIMGEPDSATAIRRVHKGYARLFFEELQARRQMPD